MDTAHVAQGNRVLEAFMTNGANAKVKGIPYHESYDWLMPVWVKFRELRCNADGIETWNMCTELNHHRDEIIKAMTYGTLPELYESLVKAVEWVNGLNKTT